jgi:tetratricopeptide (TPR) repeat protein
MGVAGFSFLRICAAGCGVLLFGVGPCRGQSAQIPSQAQSRSDTRVTKDYASVGELSIQVQETTGEPFFAGATVTLFTQNIDARQTLSTVADLNGRAKFTGLPVGTYVMEITAPGYRKVQQQVIMTGSQRARDLIISLVPVAVEGKVKMGSVTVAPKAVKETDKALRALEGNRFEEAQEHLTQALAVDPNFADGNYLMGLVLLRRKNPAKARAYLQRSVELAPEHTAALLALGEAEYLTQDYPRATDSLEKFLQAQPNSAQAAVAKKYVDAMRKVQTAAVAGESGSGGGMSDGVTPGGNTASGSSAATALTDLPAATELDPTTESSWAPPDVDDEKLELDTSNACQLDAVVKAAGRRMQELVANVNSFTATESLEHIRLSPMGIETSHELTRYKYVAEIRPIGKSDLTVEEYRTGPVAKRYFPDGIETIGLSALAMIFHPNLASRYEFRCDGLGSWSGKPAWVVHFQQRGDQKNGMLTYNVAGRSVAVSLRGRAWVDAKSMQILAMKSDIAHALPEIRLKRDHQLIEYGPVDFRNKKVELWLPKSADWYCSISGRHFHRRHSFSQFLLFSVDDKQKISTPTIPDSQ